MMQVNDAGRAPAAWASDSQAARIWRRAEENRHRSESEQLRRCQSWVRLATCTCRGCRLQIEAQLALRRFRAQFAVENFSAARSFTEDASCDDRQRFRNSDTDVMFGELRQHRSYRSAAIGKFIGSKGERHDHHRPRPRRRVVYSFRELRPTAIRDRAVRVASVPASRRHL